MPRSIWQRMPDGTGWSREKSILRLRRRASSWLSSYIRFWKLSHPWLGVLLRDEAASGGVGEHRFDRLQREPERVRDRVPSERIGVWVFRGFARGVHRIFGSGI